MKKRKKIEIKKDYLLKSYKNSNNPNDIYWSNLLEVLDTIKNKVRNNDSNPI